MKALLSLMGGALFVCSGVMAAEAVLPAAAKAAFEAKYPGAKISEIKAETKKGVTQYEVEFKDAQGIGREVELSPAGDVLSVAVDVKPADLPKAVVDTLLKAYPDAKIEEAKLETEKGVSIYEVDLKTKDGKIEAEVAADGSKILKARKATDKEDDDEKDEKK